MTSTQSLTESSRALAVRMYEAGSSGDLASLLNCLSDDVVVNEPPFLPYGATYRGHDEFTILVSRVAELLDVAKLEVKRMFAEEDRVIGIIEIPDRTTGRNIILAEEGVVRDGKFSEIYVYFHDTQAMLDHPRMTT